MLAAVWRQKGNGNYKSCLYMSTFILALSGMALAVTLSSSHVDSNTYFPSLGSFSHIRTIRQKTRLSRARSRMYVAEESIPPDEILANNFTSSIHSVDSLLNAWESIYQLRNTQPMKTSVSFHHNGNKFPSAPHLQDCFTLTQKWRSFDKRGKNTPLPKWADPSPGEQDFRPPWIQGPNDGNLKLTKFIQTQIWKNQFPADCKSKEKKFAIVKWKPMTRFGLGSSLHVFAAQFLVALSEGRTVVPAKGYFIRAERKVCKGRDEKSLTCFFQAMTSPECEQQAMYLWNRNDTDMVVHNIDYLRTADLFGSEQTLPWMGTQVTTELFGLMANLSETHKKVNFWRAQVIRFLLRFPSNRLCHETNRMRHLAFGREAAEGIAQMEKNQAAAMARMKFRWELEALKLANSRLSSGSERNLDSSVWWQEPPYMPHPIVSVYVRQGDKATEMKLFSLAAHVWLAEELKARVPDIQNVWLSTEMEVVVQQAKAMKWWKFYYSKHKRQSGHSKMHVYTKKVGVLKLTLLSFANLIMASECDYFVGPLGSNWARLINELRLTNGKLKSGFLATNFGER